MKPLSAKYKERFMPTPYDSSKPVNFNTLRSDMMIWIGYERNGTGDVMAIFMKVFWKKMAGKRKVVLAKIRSTPRPLD